MSSLDKLAIRGIRSFDNARSSVVEFQTPVTVIVGQNGTGKTTIIECLKYSATGEMPPNSKGGAFVHDPKLAGENEVKAQVKLRFQNSNSERMVVTRNLQVTAKKAGGLTMKTLEGILAKDDKSTGNHTRNTISTKCSEIDDEVPRLLGVSKAILDNVIFCHQEESNWPLSEPAPLKKKFDEIFEATKFTEALDSIKKIRKENMADLKVEREKLNHLRLEKERSETIKVKLAKIETQIARQQQSADEIGAEANDRAKINVQFREQAGEFMGIMDKYKSLQHEILVYEEQIASYEDSMTLLKESEDELRAKLQSFGRSLDEKKRRSQETQNKKSDEQETLRGLEKDLSGIVQRRGQLLGEKKMHEDAIVQREEIAKVLCATYDLKGYDYSPLEKVKIDEILDKLKDVKKRQENLIRQLKADSRTAEEELRAKLTALNADKATQVGERSGLKRQHDDLDRIIQADTRESQEESVGAIEADLNLTNQKIADQTRAATELETTISEAKYDDKRRALKVEISTKESERESLNGEFASLNQHSETRATLNVKRENLKNKDDFVRNHLEQQTEPHRKLVGTDPTAAGIESAVSRVLTEKESEISQAEKKKTVADRKLASIESIITQDKEKVKEKHAEVKALEAKIRQTLADTQVTGSLEDAISEAKEQIKILNDELEGLAEGPAIFRKMKNQAEKTHKCFGCNRKIAAEEQAAFDRHVDVMLKAAVKRLESNEVPAELAQWEEALASYHRLQPEEDRANNIRQNVIPDLEAAYEAKKGEHEQAKVEAERASEAVVNLKSQLRELVSLKSVAITITRAYKDSVVLARDVSDLEATLAATGSVRTAKDVEVELAKISTDIKSLTASLTTVTNQAEVNQKQLQTIRNGIHSRQIQLSTLQSRLQQSQVLEKRLAENRILLDQLKKQIRNLDATIASADGPIREASDAIQAHRDNFQNEKFTADATLQSHVESINSLESANVAVEKWVDSDGPRRLKKLEEQLTQKENEVEDSKLAVQEIDETIKQIETDIHTADKNRKNMDDNLRHRQFKAKKRNAETERDNLDISNARIARADYEREYAKSKKTEQDLTSQHATLQGEISSLKVQANELKDTLATEYKNIKPEYMGKLIEVKTSDLANVDLEKYGKALDSAIMQYHSVKMAEINDNLKHLWNRTYQGTDIDSILIKADSEEPKTSTAVRRNYNYRVVMTKDQVEMDMRGRCSAGQKVLASIIIRLALSDSFGHNCGIIALDEPTTNLDKENIQSLAAALANIIDERKESGNFQMIVITHDEDFLKELAKADGLDYYMRISRDNKQKSIISKHRVG